MFSGRKDCTPHGSFPIFLPWLRFWESCVCTAASGKKKKTFLGIKFRKSLQLDVIWGPQGQCENRTGFSWGWRKRAWSPFSFSRLHEKACLAQFILQNYPQRLAPCLYISSFRPHKPSSFPGGSWDVMILQNKIRTLPCPKQIALQMAVEWESQVICIM